MRFVRIFSVLWLILNANLAIGQYEIIPTGTTTDIDEIIKSGNNIVLNGNFMYLSKCFGECDNLQSILPSPFVQGSSKGLVVLDSLNYYFSHYDVSFPTEFCTIYHSSNGGQNWSQVFNSTTFLASNILVFSLDTMLLIEMNDQTVLASFDTGITWSFLNNQPIQVSSVNASLLLNDSSAIIGGMGEVALTLNKGLSWMVDSYVDAIPNNFACQTSDSIYFVSNSPINQNGILSYFFDGNLTNRIDHVIPGTLPVGLYVVSKNEVYVTGKDYFTNKGRILKTTDLGQSWMFYDVQENNYLADLVPLNDSIFLIGGQNGFLIKWNKNSPMQPLLLNSLLLKENNEMNIFPNPATSFQYIEFNNPWKEKIDIAVFDVLGREVFTKSHQCLSLQNNKVIIDLTSLCKGMYVYKITMGNQVNYMSFQKD